MRPDDASPPYATSEIGTPRDYTEDLYHFYLEVPHFDGTAERLIRDFLGERHAGRLRRLTHGFEMVMPLQCAAVVSVLVVRDRTFHNPAGPAAGGFHGADMSTMAAGG